MKVRRDDFLLEKLKPGIRVVFLISVDASVPFYGEFCLQSILLCVTQVRNL